jgi:hypothetical protein
MRPAAIPLEGYANAKRLVEKPSKGIALNLDIAHVVNILKRTAL